MRINSIGSLALLASSGLAHPELAERAASNCTTNACLGALASRTSTAKTDCSSFLYTTVTPCSKTVKSTITITSTIGCQITSTPIATTDTPVSSGAACPSTQSPSAVPSYAAGSCSDGAAFSSACSCLNVGARHTTLQASTVTVTTYKTIKATPTFVVKAVGTNLPGDYLWNGARPGQQSQGGDLFFTGDPANAEHYNINDEGRVFGGNGTLAWGSRARNCHGCYRYVYEYSGLGDSEILKCRLGTVPRGDGYLSFACEAPNGGRRFQNCDSDGADLDLGGTPDNEAQECFLLTLGAYPVC